MFLRKLAQSVFGRPLRMGRVILATPSTVHRKPRTVARSMSCTVHDTKVSGA